MFSEAVTQPLKIHSVVKTSMFLGRFSSAKIAKLTFGTPNAIEHYTPSC